MDTKRTSSIWIIWRREPNQTFNQICQIEYRWGLRQETLQAGLLAFLNIFALFLRWNNGSSGNSVWNRIIEGWGSIPKPPWTLTNFRKEDKPLYSIGRKRTQNKSIMFIYVPFLSSIQKPVTSNQWPVTRNQYPETSIQYPESSIQKPASLRLHYFNS